MKVTVAHATLPRDNPRLVAVQEAIDAVKALQTESADDWADITLCAGGDDFRYLYVMVRVEAATEAAALLPLELVFAAARGDGTRILVRKASAVQMQKEFERDRVIWRGYTRFVVGYTNGDIEHLATPGYGVSLAGPAV